MNNPDRYTFTYHDDIKCAELVDNEYKIKAVTFERTPKASVVAYLAARYSRSSESIVDTFKQLLNEGEEPIENISERRLESIFHGYGHRSVGDAAEIVICLEGISLYQAEVLWNWIPVVSGQARSTRYQDFITVDKSLVTEVPETLGLPKAWVDLYKDILDEQIVAFSTLYAQTEQDQAVAYNVNLDNKKDKETNRVRALDTARYLLPLGLRSSVALFINATNLSDIISNLLGSSNLYNNAVGKLLLELMTNKEYEYNKQAESLIRHTDPKYTYYKLESQLKDLILGEGFYYIADNCKSILNSISVTSQASIYNILTHIIQLAYPRILDLDIQADLDADQAKRLLTQVSDIIFNNITDRDQPSPIVQTCCLGFYGLMDIGSARDLNRHRSTKRFFAYLSDQYPTYIDLLTTNVSSKYTISPYLETKPELQYLAIEYEQCLSNYYFKIQQLITLGLDHNIPEDILNEFTKYLLPMGHLVNYSIYGDLKAVSYIAHLRTRPGGHIAYRMIVNEWVTQLAQESDFFLPLLQNLGSVDPESNEEYLNRS
jgi:thymidylate synthase ThyX